MSNRRFKSIIEELDGFVSQRDRHQIVEVRANNVIASVVNLMTLIQETFSVEESEELQRRLLGAIKNQDPEKFSRKLREYRRQGGQKDD